MIKIITFTLLFVLVVISVRSSKLDTIYAWKELSYDWPSESVKLDAINTHKYVEKNNLPLGLERWKDKLFVTVPRWKHGVPASLNYIDLTDKTMSPVLHPYPSWEANTLPGENNDAPIADGAAVDRAHAKKAEKTDLTIDNSTIISTFRIRVDECDRLWVMDTGLSDILGNAKQIAPSALVIFDLRTNQLVRRFSIPDDQSKEDTFFANVIIDVNPADCGNAFAYIPDLGTYSAIVYSFKENKSWRVKHNFFHFDPLKGDYNIGGINFQWTDGVFGMALDKMQEDGSRRVYFHALSSTREFYVSNKILQNETLSQSPEAYYDYKYLGDRGPNGQSSAEFLDEKSGVLFYTQVNKDAIGCWNTRKPYTIETQGLVDSDSDALVFPNDLKVDQENKLWVLSDRMPVFIFGQLDSEQYNYRILSKSVNDAIKGTPCEN